MQELRDYQAQALERLRHGFRSGLQNQLLVAPTGSGKTVVAAEMMRLAASRGRRVLFVAHRRELILQARARLGMGGIIMPGHEPTADTVQVGSIQTLIRRGIPPADLVVIDEAHHAAADSYHGLFEGNAHRVGLTATPWRVDGRGLAGHFDGLVLAATPRQLIEQGHLVDYEGFRFVSPNVETVRVVQGDYAVGQLSLECRRSPIIGNVVEQWRTHASGMRTIVFAVDIEHAEELKHAFGDVAETLDYQSKSRDAVVARIRSGATRVAINVGILTEGVDIPELECCIMARPTQSLALYLQQVGRVMRPSPGKLVARIHDHAGNVERHGLPDEERDYSLTAGRRANASGTTGLTTCLKCFAIFRRQESCPSCLAPLPDGRERPGEEAGEAIDIRAPKSEMNAYKDELMRIAIEKGYKPGWLVHQFLQRYPKAPKPWGAYRQLKTRLP